jgi:enamidase
MDCDGCCVNIGTLVSGDSQCPIMDGDSIVMADGVIATVGSASSTAVATCDVVIGAGGTTAAPGFIDSHVHITFGRRKVGPEVAH